MTACDILWEPGSPDTSSLANFCAQAGFHWADYHHVHRWSVSDPGGFWSLLWDFCGVIGTRGVTAFVPDSAAPMTGARFFPDARLNLAENLLMRGSPEDIAVCAADETGRYTEMTRAELQRSVARVAKGLREAGVAPGDRVAGIQGNTPDALVATLATLSIGAIWTSCSPDFGTAAIIDRIGQVEPKTLFVSPKYTYGGKSHDISERLSAVRQAMPSVTTLVASGSDIVGAVRQETFGADAPLQLDRFPFDHPAYILYTSGTTGAPKAIVHRAGGVLLQHLKEHILHGDVHPGDRVIWYTNTAWMMYHWNISALAAGAAVVLYDGATILKSESGLDCAPLWSLAERAGITCLGVSPKYLSTLAAEGYTPRSQHDLEALRTLLVCGAPCLPHQFDWVYEAVKSDMMFASISGGTEILGSFLIGSPLHPVRRGQLTVLALGHAVAVMDDRNAPVIGQRGDLVCTEPFPSMPLTFWGEGGDKRYRDTYFADRDQIWTHGDVAEMTVTGGAYVHGRTDNTLKPGGVRIGSSEIYAICERFDEFEDMLVFGAQHNGDEEVVLAIKPKPDARIDPAVIKDLRARIRSTASPRHVPARVHLVSAIPYTINGKRVESAARTTVNGGQVNNLGSLANPDCLAEYAALKREDAL